ncbi:MAG TPA: Crp/Fnr family transcriptional regulator, partial [Flavobacteriaceae bacterium]|nr:Crp/Fnr family transcriptional regulator [Flavobacteriaceae bacterium]
YFDLLMLNPSLLEQVKSRIYRFYNISDTSFEKLKAISKFKSFNSGAILDNQGDVPKQIYVIINGYCRSYFRLENGKEFTKTIFKPLDFFASFYALVNQVPSDCIYETLTDCDLLIIDYQKYQELKENNHDIFTFHSYFMEYLICENDLKHKELLSMNATERYLKLQQQIPNINHLMPQYQIATYLSVTPVQLSRIRAKLKN